LAARSTDEPPVVAPVETTGIPSEPSATDLAVLAEQLGRPPRGVAEIAVRCRCGNPVVVRTLPRLPDGSPFPTTYYLTHPAATAAASRLEAEGVMREFNAQLAANPELAAAYRAAHEAYLADRAELAAEAGLDDVPEIAHFSAGGMPDRVKCLHALVAHALARPGVNPIGEAALALMAEDWSIDRCSCATQPSAAPPE